MWYYVFFQDTTKIQAIRKLVPANIELYLIRMTVALLEKEDRDKPRDVSGVKRMLVWSEQQQEETGAGQARGAGALWSKPKVSHQGQAHLCPKSRTCSPGRDDQAHAGPPAWPVTAAARQWPQRRANNSCLLLSSPGLGMWKVPCKILGLQ